MAIHHVSGQSMRAPTYVSRSSRSRPHAEGLKQNEKLDRTIVFSGYHPDHTTILQGKIYGFTYFADAFMYV
jgi:hypothetical protein